MKPLVFVVLAACAAEQGGLEVTVEAPDGKADGIAGRRLGIAINWERSPYLEGSTTLSDWVYFRGTDDNDVLSIRAPRYEPVDVVPLVHDVAFRGLFPESPVGLVMLDPYDHVAACETPRGRINVFRHVVLDMQRRQITLNDDLTVDVRACGIDREVAFVPVPLVFAPDVLWRQASFELDYIER